MTSDPLVDDAVSIELGYSVMAGGSKLQMGAWRKGEAFELRATAKAPELNVHAEVAAKLAWEHLLRRFPKIGEKMLTEAAGACQVGSPSSRAERSPRLTK